MSWEEFFDGVLMGLRCDEIYRAGKSEDFESQLKKLYERKFSVAAAVSYVKCWEEINPDLDEETALSRMDEISKRYPHVKKFKTNAERNGR